ncbi:hypothetical protein J2X98_002331 [Pseudarthrobacter enclensis]|uniref:MarR family transcriptional regulator n=1 Tax=Pseudarthrobacter enclensis TaxID=993070 RepID=A0ABT9RU15_9MICC|nr:hypothetical protein [Pseudarthrobacter enclensis]
MTELSIPQTETAGAKEDLLREKQLCFALSVAARNVVAAYKPVLDRMGLTHPQYLVMLRCGKRAPDLREIYPRVYRDTR